MRHVFITGCGRSGTTMMGSILGACQGAVATPEADFFLEYYYRTGGQQTTKEDYIRFLKNNYRFRQWELPADRIPLVDADFSPFNLASIMEKTVASYAAEHFQISDPECIRIDHTPSNIKYFQKLEKSLPSAKHVFMIRDPRAVFASVRDLDWGANTAYRLSIIWMNYAAQFFAVQRLIPDRILLVRYEDVVQDPAKELKRVCNFCKLEYRPEILKGGGLKLPEYTMAQHAQVGQAPNPANIDKWKKKLTERDVLILESSCSTIMSAFGYERTLPDTFRVGLRDQLQSMFRESYLYLTNKFRKRKREKAVS